MERIRERLRKLKHSREPLSPPPLPCLPDERPRPLTAAPCAPAATANSLFFQRVPPEIRRRILVAAFGDRTLHLDVRLEHPLRKTRASGKHGINSRPPRHANVQLFQHDLRDSKQPREWTWWSSVCHRTFPSWNYYLPPPGCWRFEDPANDTCRRASGGAVHYCESYPGTMPSKCFIGILPWLLACRQAYIEGIDVLYATNRLHIAHAGILINLPRLLTPDRLHMIRDVELLWSLCLSPSGADREWTTGVEEDRFRDVNDRLVLLSHIPRALPNLQYLHLSLTDAKWAWKPILDLCGQELYDATETILRCIDTMVLVQLVQLRECRISLPTTLYMTRKQMEKNEDIIWARKATNELEALWRTIDLTATSTQPPAERRNNIEGYWILHGEQEMENPMITEVW
ncbi:uncharacterized protein PG986_007957 [Apiospora aurea]|uniref:DUF7730 domain-containing protein n=1 Tax=Apiospora aurea TaxID=335848 RepID=A0ABR1QE96_9PEZI